MESTNPFFASFVKAAFVMPVSEVVAVHVIMANPVPFVGWDVG